MKEIAKLTDLELKIMCVLWESARNITIQEITELSQPSKISPQSITQSVNHLIKKGAVRVESHILVSNVYARTFVPCFSQEEYMSAEINRLSNAIFKKNSSSITNAMAALLNNSDSTIMDKKELIEIEKIIEKKKKQIGD